MTPWRVFLGGIVLIAGLLVACDGPLMPSPMEPPPEGPESPEAPAIPALSVSGTSFVTPSGPFRWIGLTSFDAGVRLAEGDRSWIDWAADEGFTVLRVVPASQFRTPRSLNTGLLQLGPLLTAAASRGLYVEVVIGVDTALYGLTEAAFTRYAEQVASVVRGYDNAVIEVANEIGHHSTQQGYLASPHVQRYVLGLFSAPGSAGSTHGGQAPFWDLGAFLTHHADRRLSPLEASARVAAAQARLGKPIVIDEHLGIGPVERVGSRTSDPQYALEQARGARQYGLGGVTLHLEAGLDARVSQLSSGEREAARLFVQEMRR